MLPEILKDGTMKLNESYQEILKLDQMLTDSNIPHDLVRLFDGWQVFYPSKESNMAVADAVEHFGSYGHDEDKLEIMGALLTPDEYAEDIVVGHLSAMNVFERISEHYYVQKMKKGG